MTLSEIIKRLEKATGPDRELDADIRLVLFGTCVYGTKGPRDAPTPGDLSNYVEQYRDVLTDDDDLDDEIVPRVTASVDAAIALAEKVLPGEPVNMGWAQTLETRPWARVGAWSAPDATGPTPALALVTAVLTALRAKQEGNQP